MLTRLIHHFLATLMTTHANMETISNCIQQCSVNTFGFSSKNHQNWFDDNNLLNWFDDNDLLKAKNEAHNAKLRNPSSVTLHNKLKELRSKAQKELRQCENNWLIQNALEI